MRVSNFLIWQGAYAEWFVTPTYWPDFGPDELLEAVLAYAQRERRYGKVEDPV
jgi:undecaprenyl diphosphate synthase